MPILTWVFGAEDIGRMNLFQVILSFGLLLFVLGLDQSYVREFHVTKNKARLLKTCFSPGFILLCVACLVSFFSQSKLSHWLYGEENTWLVAITAVGILAGYISRFLSLILRMQERGQAYSISQIAPKALLLVLLGVVILFDVRRDFFTLLCITATSLIATVLVHAWYTREQWYPAFKIKPMPSERRALLLFGLPLIFSGLAYWGMISIGTIILRSQSTLGELGIYAVTSSIAGGVAILQSIFTIVWSPTVYKWVEQGVDMSRLEKIAQKVLALVCSVFIIAGLFSWVIDFVLPAYYFQVKYLIVCAIAPSLLYTLSEITSVGIGISRRTILTVWVTIISLAVNIVIGWYLVPSYGATGAVVANAIAHLIFFVIRSEISRRVWRASENLKIYIFVTAFVIFSIASASLGALYQIDTALLWLCLVPVVVVAFKKEWRDIKSFILFNLGKKFNF